jgi:hypothetical protein
VRFLPESAARADWPRLVAQIVNGLVRREVNYPALQDFADDTAAAAGGVEIGGLYRTGSTVKVRVS